MTIKILLLQTRHADDAVRLEERSSFATMAGVDETHVIPYDLLTSTPTLTEVRQYDALMVGGSGDYYVSKENLPNFEGVLALLADVTAVGHPTFASCFGFQLLVKALGGEIMYDAKHAEVGTYELRLTKHGRSDDLASSLPKGVLHLAASEFAPFQALRVPDQPIWAVQFHPELTKTTNLARFRRYMAGYASMMDAAEVERTLARFDESPEANQLIGRFMQLVFD